MQICLLNFKCSSWRAFLHPQKNTSQETFRYFEIEEIFQHVKIIALMEKILPLRGCTKGLLYLIKLNFRTPWLVHYFFHPDFGFLLFSQCPCIGVKIPEALQTSKGGKEQETSTYEDVYREIWMAQQKEGWILCQIAPFEILQRMRIDEFASISFCFLTISSLPSFIHEEKMPIFLKFGFRTG